LSRRVKGRPIRKAIHHIVAIIPLLMVVACTTIQPTRIAEFGQGVDKVKLQLDTTFTTVNQMVTEDEIERAVERPTITEDDIAVVLRREDIAKWDKAFQQLDAYVAKLSSLLSSENPQNFAKALGELGTEMKTLNPQALPSAGVATGFAELGRLLIQAKAQRDARRIASKTDPAMKSIFMGMAEVIGPDHSRELRGTVWEHWKERMGAQRVAFLAAKDKLGTRREIVKAYIALRDNRDAQDLQLASLRQSILDLASAHEALARGSDTDLAAAVTMIQQELDVTRSLNEQFKALKY
jgi:hypothetical protein